MLIVISCGGKKRAGVHPAAVLYVGPYFRACLAWARTRVRDRDIRILSGRYGLVELHERLQSYETRIAGPDGLAHQKLAEQAARLPPHDRVIVVGGRAYVAAIRRVWPAAECPFEALPKERNRMGYQMKWMAQDRARHMRGR